MDLLIDPFGVGLVLTVAGMWWGVQRDGGAFRRKGLPGEDAPGVTGRDGLLLDALPDTVLLVDAYGAIVDYHARTEMAGLSGIQVIGKDVMDVLPRTIGTKILRAVRQVLETGETQQVEFTVPPGATAEEGQCFEARVVSCWDDRALVIVRNVTERERAERSIREAESKFRILVEQSLAGIFIVQAGRIVYANPRFAEILGTTPEALVACENVTELVLPDDRPVAREWMDTRETESVHYALRWMRQDGEVLYTEVYSSVTDYRGEPAVIGTLIDVTEQREAQEKLRVLGMAVEQSAEGVLVIDPNGIVRFVNPAWARMHGWTPEEVTGQHFRIFHTEEQMRREVFPMIHAFQKTRVLRAEMGHKRRDGSTFPSQTAFATLRDDQGQVVGAVGICRDITDQKQYEAELLSAKERAEEMSRLKSSFLTNMSHEIRTPLAGIIGFATVLEDEVPDDQGEFAGLIRTSGERLMQTLNSVLDLARLEAGEMVLVPEDVDLRREVEAASGMFRAMAHEKGLDFRLAFSDETLPAELDPHGFGMVLNNLIGNAVKFTEQGDVQVALTADERAICLRVADTGIGIDPGFLPHLFDEFKQESSGLTRSHEGSGLGLSITRRLVELMGGRIRVESAKGKGTVFTVDIPRTLPARLPNVA